MKSNKKAAAKKSMRPKKSKAAGQGPTVPADFLDRTFSRSNGTRYEQPRYRNLEKGEEREKRLAKRKALTLRAFQIAYENHHRRKAS